MNSPSAFLTVENAHWSQVASFLPSSHSFIPLPFLFPLTHCGRDLELGPGDIVGDCGKSNMRREFGRELADVSVLVVRDFRGIWKWL